MPSVTCRAPKQPTAKAESAHASTVLQCLKQGGWGTYFHQSILPAALALALLYLTVLSLGLLMTAYLKWQGMTEAKLSLYRGAGAISGLLSTVVFPPIHNKAGNHCSVLQCMRFACWLRLSLQAFSVQQANA